MNTGCRREKILISSQPYQADQTGKISAPRLGRDKAACSGRIENSAGKSRETPQKLIFWAGRAKFGKKRRKSALIKLIFGLLV
jgi:hypothetical protein